MAFQTHSKLGGMYIGDINTCMDFFDKNFVRNTSCVKNKVPLSMQAK